MQTSLLILPVILQQLEDFHSVSFLFQSSTAPPVINITLTSGYDETLLQPINSCWGRCTDYTSNLEVFIKNPVLGV